MFPPAAEMRSELEAGDVASEMSSDGAESDSNSD